MLVHRLVWMQDNGHTDLFICHACDNPRCVNIDHLYAGTHAQNMSDMTERGRAKNQKKSACPQGHPYDRIYNGSRRCTKCMAASNKRKRDERRKAAA